MAKTTYAYQSPFRNGVALVQNEQGLYGFINEAGEEFVPCQYENASLHVGDKARVQKDGLWGLINAAGKLVADYAYDSLSHLMNGCLLASQGEKLGVIGQKGTPIVPIQYGNVDDYNNGKLFLAYDAVDDYYESTRYENFALYTYEGKALAKRGKYEYIQATEFDSFVVRNNNGKSGVMDIEGNIILPLQYEGLEVIGKDAFIVSKKDKQGLLGREGKEILPVKYHSIARCYFQAEISAPYLIVTNMEYLHGLYQPTGEEIYPCIYSQIAVRTPEEIILKSIEKALVCDSKSNQLSPKEYGNLEFIADGHYAFTNLENQELWGILNERFEMICKPMFQALPDATSAGGSVVVSQRVDGGVGYGLFHLPTRQTVLPAQFENVGAFLADGKEMFWTQNGVYFGLVDNLGKTILGCEFLDFTDAGGLLHITTKHGKKGVITYDFDFVVTPQYDEVWEGEEENTYHVRQKYYFDTQGKQLAEKAHFPFIYNLQFSDGMAVLDMNQQYGYLGSDYEWAIKPQFTYAEPFKNGVAIVQTHEGAGIINREGAWIVEPKFAGISRCEFDADYFSAYDENYRYNLMHISGEEVLPAISYSAIEKKGDWARCYVEEGYYFLQNLKTNQRIGDEKRSPYLFEKGLALCLDVEANKHYFINEKEKLAFELAFDFDDTDAFADGIAILWRYIDDSYAKYYVAINVKGEILFEAQAYGVRRVAKNILAVSNEDYATSFIDFTGQPIVEGVYSSVTPLIDGRLLLENLDNETGKTAYFIFNPKGKKLKQLKYDYVFANENCPVLTVGKYFAKSGENLFYGMADTKGNGIWHILYESAEVCSEGYTLVKKGNAGALNFEGNVMVELGYDDYASSTGDIIIMYKEEIIQGKKA